MAQAARMVGGEVDLVEHYYERGFSDGLPVVPPTPEKIDAAVSALVLGEAVLLCLLGGVLGTALALLAAAVIGPGIEQAIGVFEVRAATVASALGLAAALGLVVGAFPAVRAKRLSIVAAMRQ